MLKFVDTNQENPTKRDIENFRKYSDSNPQISSFLDDFFY